MVGDSYNLTSYPPISSHKFMKWYPLGPIYPENTVFTKMFVLGSAKLLEPEIGNRHLRKGGPEALNKYKDARNSVRSLKTAPYRLSLTVCLPINPLLKFSEA